MTKSVNNNHTQDYIVDSSIAKETEADYHYHYYWFIFVIICRFKQQIR